MVASLSFIILMGLSEAIPKIRVPSLKKCDVMGERVVNSCQNVVSERVSHHIALPLHLGQLAMYITLDLTGYYNLDLPHKGKPLWFGPDAGSTWGGVISFLSPGLSLLRLFPSVLLPFHLFCFLPFHLFPDHPF
jgi:hypothetical protein